MKQRFIHKNVYRNFIHSLIYKMNYYKIFKVLQRKGRHYRISQKNNNMILTYNIYIQHDLNDVRTKSKKILEGDF